MKFKVFLTAVAVTMCLTTNCAFAGDVAAGKVKFEQLCAQCHGNTGLGDGPIGLSLPPGSKPASLADGTYKFATDDAKMKELIQKGGAGVGLSPLMPPQAALDEETITNIIAFVNSLKK